jgi:hypothetical protein
MAALRSLPTHLLLCYTPSRPVPPKAAGGEVPSRAVWRCPACRAPPLDVRQLHQPGRRICDRQGVAEVQFLARDHECVLPVLHGGRLLVLPWGNCRRVGLLPPTLWTATATIAAGRWSHTEAEECVIPAALRLDGGIWFLVGSGGRGLVVSDERSVWRVYIVVEPASRYFSVMTKSRWQMCVGERMEWHH